MVLDPFSALGLANNVVQFVDFGSKLFSGAAELYRSVDGALAVNAELEIIFEDLSNMSSELGTASLYEMQDMSADVKNLIKLARSCKKLADELLSTLGKLKVPHGRRKWNSVRQALASAWREKEIRAYTERLINFRSQMTIHLFAVLSNENSSVLKALNALNERHKRFEILSVSEPEKLKRDLLELFTVHIPTNLKEDILAAMAEMGPKIAKHMDLTALQSKLSACENECSKLDTGLRILGRLHFPMINSRHTNITVAHSSTYEWIFQRAPRDGCRSPQFVRWLESQDGIYWINGKAGSGKSTLMKFICESERTIQFLRIWAGDRTLVTASYFFWKSGKDMQKSLEGLLRSLLYRILQQCPTMISALPVQSLHVDQMSIDTHAWSLQELSTTFSRIKAHEASVKFCFFIDGLDEYDGFHADVIDIITSLISSSNIKVCLSSRPWNVFDDAFGGGAYPNLRLQDQTRKDIQLFVTDKFEGNRHFTRLRLQDKRYEDLVLEIVQKAQGVFLWVSLVIRSLLRGFTNSDTISDLQRRLALLPTDLEKYFKFMLDSTEEVYHRQAARILQICLASGEPPSLITMSFYDEQDPEYGMKSKMKMWRKDDLDELYRDMCKRVNARCVDLVEVTTEEESQEVSPFKVEFLHRTVRDFLATKDIQSILIERQGKEFDANAYLCQAYLAQMKHMPSVIDQFAKHFIFQVSQIERKLKTPQVDLLDEFHRVLVQEKSTHFDMRMPKSPDFKVENGSSDYQRAWLLASCVRQGLVLSVRSQLEAPDRPFGPTFIDWLLKVVLTSNRWTYTHHDTDLENLHCFETESNTLRILMDHGADPNHSLEGRSIWDYFLTRMKPVREEEKKVFAQYIEVLLSKRTNSNTNNVVRNAIQLCLGEDRSRLYALFSDNDKSEPPNAREKRPCGPDLAEDDSAPSKSQDQRRGYPIRKRPRLQ